MTDRDASEVNFDGLVGPTHNYAGLAYGNLASLRHRQQPSNPRMAALQGLAKMKFLHDLGLTQAVLPPQERPDVLTLRRLGFHGSNEQVLHAALRDAPVLLAAATSASSMWAANAATVSPSPDTDDHRLHLTPANLVSQFHRSLEAQLTGHMFQLIFHDESHFAIHPPLPASVHFSDEGAANHTRLCRRYAETGIELFVFGRRSFNTDTPQHTRFPARQTLEASQAIARAHRLDPDRTVFAQQHPQAIDAGVFHNDVICVGNRNVLLYHEHAFADQDAVLRAIAEKYRRHCGDDLRLIEVPSEQVSLADAIGSYLFNSQLINVPEDGMALLCPIECRETPSVAAFLQRLIASRAAPIDHVHYVDVRQSMRNGGGPACLRLRVVLAREQITAAHRRVFLTDDLYQTLTTWVHRHYRESLKPEDLADAALLREARTALDELTRILGLGSIYPFQQSDS